MQREKLKSHKKPKKQTSPHYHFIIHQKKRNERQRESEGERKQRERGFREKARRDSAAREEERERNVFFHFCFFVFL